MRRVAMSLSRGSPRVSRGNQLNFMRCAVRHFGTDTCADLSWNKAGVNRDGFPWPPDCTEKSMEFAYNWKGNDNDIYVATYPKSGTTWMLHTLYQLASKGDNDFSALHHVVGYWEGEPDIHVSLKKLSSPRVIKTHSPLSLIPDFRARRGKFVYVVRDPRDVVVSFYNHSMLSKGGKSLEAGGFDAFLDKFLNGQLYYGSWFDHVEDALRQRELRPNDVLFVTYEDMKKDLAGMLPKLAKFANLEVDETTMKKIEPRLSFQWMKDNADRLDFTQHYPNRDKTKSFFREGKAGGWKETFGEKNLDDLRAKYDATVHGRLPYKI